MRIRLRHILLGGLALLALAGLVFWSSEDARNSARLRAAEAIGDAASAVLAEATSGGNMERSADLINNPVEVRPIGDRVLQARGVANTHLIPTAEGHVVFDTGLATQAAKQRRLLAEAAPDAPITHVILSHSHQDHVGGTSFWTEEGTKIIAHEDYLEEQRYLKALEPYFWKRNRMLFPFMPEEPPTFGFLEYGNVRPTVTVGDGETLAFEQGGVRFEALGTPGAEGADNLVLWLPDEKILLSGDFFGPNFPQFPNVFTMRGEKMRKPVEYIESLERLIALEPEVVIPSHNNPVEGKEKIRSAMTRMRDAVRFVHDSVVEGMNQGKTVYELMAEIQLPAELALPQNHGRVSWAVKSIWEYYATWFHFDRTTELYPVPASEVYEDLVELAGADPLVERAVDHLGAGRPVHALHLLEIALEAEPANKRGLEARRAALLVLYGDAQEELRNSYEMDWLQYRIRATEATLGTPDA